MGFFDFLKNFKSKDELAKALQKAFKDISLRPAFYNMLLETDIFVLIYGNNLPTGIHAFNEGDKVNIIRMNDKKIPVFSSKEKIFENNIIKEGVTFASIRGRDFLKMTKGETLILNPYSKFKKELPPEEIGSMLEGNLPGMQTEPIIFENQSEVIVGLPAERPREMIESIKAYCSGKPEIESVYLAIFRLPENDEKPRFIIAVDAPGNLSEIFGDITRTVKQHLYEGEAVDLTPLQGSSFEDYFTTIDPIYRK